MIEAIGGLGIIVVTDIDDGSNKKDMINIAKMKKPRDMIVWIYKKSMIK